MGFAVLIDAEAEEEWSEAAACYEKREPGVGLRFNEEVWANLQPISKQPDRFRLVAKNVRKAKIIDWPYSVYFAVNTERREVKVIAIWHERRNPAKLRGRLK